MKFIIHCTLATLLIASHAHICAADTDGSIIMRSSNSKPLCCIPQEDSFCALGTLKATRLEDQYEAAAMWKDRHYVLIAQVSHRDPQKAPVLCAALKGLIDARMAQAIVNASPKELSRQARAISRITENNEYTVIVYNGSTALGSCINQFDGKNCNVLRCGMRIGGASQLKLFAQQLAYPNKEAPAHYRKAQNKFQAKLRSMAKGYGEEIPFEQVRTDAEQFAQEDANLLRLPVVLLDLKKLADFAQASSASDGE